MTHDVVRYVAIFLSVIVCALLPRAVGVKNRPGRIWLFLICVELYIFSSIVSMGYHIGDGPPRWYRSPVIIVASTIGIVYIVLVLMSKINNRGSNRDG